MLQRRIGTICTRSGCAVCTSPRANSRTERALRLTARNDKREIIASGRTRLGRTQPAHPFANLQRSLEDHRDRDKSEQLVARDGGEAGRRDAAALAAVGGAAVLARRDPR